VVAEAEAELVALALVSWLGPGLDVAALRMGRLEPPVLVVLLLLLLLLLLLELRPSPLPEGGRADIDVLPVFPCPRPCCPWGWLL
jgi:hypothetical protein